MRYLIFVGRVWVSRILLVSYFPGTWTVHVALVYISQGIATQTWAKLHIQIGSWISTVYIWTLFMYDPLHEVTSVNHQFQLSEIEPLWFLSCQCYSLAVILHSRVKCMWTVVGIQLLCEYAHLSKWLVQASIHTHTCQCNPTSLELTQACPNFFPAQFRVVTSSSAPPSKTRLSDHAITTLKCIVCEDCQIAIVCMNNQRTTSPL